MSVAPRRFEFSEGTSHKFWEIATRGTEVKAQFDRIGADGQVQVKSFADEQAAAKHVEEMVHEKQSKGYRAIA